MYRKDVYVSYDRKDVFLWEFKDENFVGLSTGCEYIASSILPRLKISKLLLICQYHCSGLDELRESVEKMKMQVAESNRQESMLVMRLGSKEREVQELLVS